MVEELKIGDNVLIISSNDSPFDRQLIDDIVIKVGQQFVNHITVNEINQTMTKQLSFDAIVTNVNRLDDTLLSQLLALLKKNSALTIVKIHDCQSANIISSLVLNGYVNVSETLNEIIARKPQYESGSSVKLNLQNGKKESAKVWSLAALDVIDDSVDLINEDDLLDDEDRQKPSAESLRVCGTTKQKKACANCTCGLAEQLEQQLIDDIQQNSQNAKSSCGSCYLGDAFRCAGCPYLGMPAFKPGEKVVLDDSSDL